MDWYPWGEAAFEASRRTGKPIFLSIGYSTCHWCHVMERESFDDPETARVLNRHFIAVKVDREERPDVDKVYMGAALAAGWGSGWPLSVWLTPRLDPFYGGTYFPARPEPGRPAFRQVLERIASLWRERREGVAADAQRLAAAMRRQAALEAGGRADSRELLKGGFEALRHGFDAKAGGFGGAPKFPMPSNQAFLLRYAARTGEGSAAEMALRTLRAMAAGGLNDQLGGGFHRYATDAQWRVPHFEKTLYDNAQLAVNFVEAYALSKEERFASVARDTVDYVLRDLADPEGAFHSAEDADSPPVQAPSGAVHHEGAFYRWTRAEVLAAAGPEAGALACDRYGVEPEGEGVLFLARPIEEVAARSGKPEAEARALLEEAGRKLLEARAKRPRPARDDKVLAAWNGLMLSALAKAAQVLDEPRYLAAAEAAARFLRAKLYDAKTGRLRRRWRAGQSRVGGMADDYAFLVQGLLDLYEASFDPAWLDWALRLTEVQNALFADAKRGGLYLTAEGHDPRLPLRPLADVDGVEPAASSVAALNGLRLFQLTGREDLRAGALKTLERYGPRMRERPLSMAQMYAALDYAEAKPLQIVLAGARGAADMKALLREVRGRFLPNKVVILVEPGQLRERFGRWLPFVMTMEAIEGKATAYVCVDRVCKLPTNDPAELGRLLDAKP